MKKLLLLVCFFCSTFIATAQHYQCFQRDANVHWYVDTIGYLRAIRVDSVKIEGNDTVYYPFVTQRAFAPFFYPPAVASWVGRAVHEQPGGNFLFNNVYGDTVIIETQAGVGNSWLFYHDTGSKYYMATVTAADTMTIGGAPDSVKYITINTYSPLLDTYDFVNGFSFILSKSHGFARAFDFYNFPYRLGPFSTDTDPYVGITRHPPRAQLFNRFDFRIPTMLEMYDYHPGDVFQYYTNTYCACPAFGGGEAYEHDTIIYRNDPDPYHAVIAIQKTVYSRYVYCPAPDANPLTMNMPYVDTLRLDTSASFTIHPLPEEDSQRFAFFYQTADTSFCINSPAVRWLKSSMFEECSDEEDYKVGLGLTYKPVCTRCEPGEPVFHVTTTNLIYYRKNELSCGDRYPMAINDVANPNNTFSVSPNPVADALTINMLAGHVEGTYYLFNNLGQVLQSGMARNKTSLDVSKIAGGLYYLTVTLPDGSRSSAKVVVAH